MDNLNLPIIKMNMKEPRNLSMDEYVEFVEEGLKYLVDEKSNDEIKAMLRVDVPFVIKNDKV